MEVAPQVRPAGGFAELAFTVRAFVIQRIEPGIGVCLQDTAAVLQVLADMLGY